MHLAGGSPLLPPTASSSLPPPSCPSCLGASCSSEGTGDNSSPSAAAILGGEWRRFLPWGCQELGAQGAGRWPGACSPGPCLPRPSSLLLWLEEQGRGSAGGRRCMPSSLQSCLGLQHKKPEPSGVLGRGGKSTAQAVSWVETCWP